MVAESEPAVAVESVKTLTLLIGAVAETPSLAQTWLVPPTVSESTPFGPATLDPQAVFCAAVTVGEAPANCRRRGHRRRCRCSSRRCRHPRWCGRRGSSCGAPGRRSRCRSSPSRRTTRGEVDVGDLVQVPHAACASARSSRAARSRPRRAGAPRVWSRRPRIHRRHVPAARAANLRAARCLTVPLRAEQRGGRARDESRIGRRPPPPNVCGRWESARDRARLPSPEGPISLSPLAALYPDGARG